MATKTSELRNSQADDLVANLDKLEIKDSTGPTTIIDFSGLTWGSASSGTVSATSTPHSGSATNGGDADEARLYDSGSSGEEITGLTVTATGNGGDIQLDNTNINSGQTVEITSIDVTEPANTQ